MALCLFQIINSNTDGQSSMEQGAQWTKPRWCYIPNMKALSYVVSDKKIFGSFISKWLMQPTGTVWTTLIGDHPGIIPVKFGQNPMSGFRGEDV